MTFTTFHLWCDTCKNRTKSLQWDYEPTPACATCGGAQGPLYGQGNKAATIIGDECDFLAPHGVCHEDGSPRRFTSKAEYRQALAAKGLENIVTHVPNRGSDKSKFTTRWI